MTFRIEEVVGGVHVDAVILPAAAVHPEAGFLAPAAPPPVRKPSTPTAVTAPVIPPAISNQRLYSSIT
jgi:hypothetical protein